MAHVTGNRGLMRDLNTKLALRHIRRSHTISQIDLVRRTHLSVGTIVSIVRELKAQDFVREIGPGQSSKGRKPTLLQFNPKAKCIVAAEIYSDETRLVLFDMAASPIRRDAFPTRLERGPAAVLDELVGGIEGVLAAESIPKDRVLGAGLCTEGLVDAERGRLLWSARWGWRDVAVKDMVESRLGLPVWVESDGHAMVLGEYLHGVGRGTGNLVALDIDMGIGSVFVADGRIYRGAHQMAGEIGHVTVRPDGLGCRCGRRGCLETVASGWAILQRARQAVAEGRLTRLGPEIHSPSSRTAIRAVFEAARQGDDLAGEIVKDAAGYLGLAVASIVNYSDPELIVLIGMVTQESQGLLRDAIARIAREHILDSAARPVRIEEGTLKENAALIGMASLVCENTFRVPIG